MDSSFIPAAVQNLWNEWNIRGCMILSLCMQLILTLAAPLRQKTSNGFVIFIIWSAYVLADAAALFAFGLISNAGCQHLQSDAQVDPDVMGLWAAFLLIHLGGPDTITAFSMEDNALWMRHLIGLVAQFSVFLYIFLKTLPHNKLLVPTILIAVAGVIKYGERTRSLYLASLDNLKDSIKRTNDTDSTPYDPKLLPFSDMIKGLIVDIMPDLSECNDGRDAILNTAADVVLGKILKALNVLYEVLYTKIEGQNSRWGLLNRSIASYNALAAFILFFLVNKDEFHGVDVAITYALLVGIFVLIVASIVMFGTSVLPKLSFTNLLLLLLGQGVFYLVSCALYQTTSFLTQGTAVAHFMGKVWSERMGSFNLLSYCLKQSSSRNYRKQCKFQFIFHYSALGFLVSGLTIYSCTTVGFIRKKFAEMRHTSNEDFVSDLWKLVFEDLKMKAQGTFTAESSRLLYEARGGRALANCPELRPYIENIQYDHMLLIWHVATEICYNIDEGFGDTDDKKRFSKLLSDYMLYLLVRQPKLLSPVAGIGHLRYEDTCVEAQQLGGKLRAPNMCQFCISILQQGTNNLEENAGSEKHGKLSVLKDSLGLVTLLSGKNNRWEVIFKVWVELLTYAAGHCRAASHARLVSEGSEFISLVWALMARLGVFAEFPIE